MDSFHGNEGFQLPSEEEIDKQMKREKIYRMNKRIILIKMKHQSYLL
jgi:hypothetical protein